MAVSDPGTVLLYFIDITIGIFLHADSIYFEVYCAVWSQALTGLRPMN